MSHQLFNLDYLDFLSKIDNNSIDLILTDIPYESLNKHRRTGTTTRLKSTGWFDTLPNKSLPSLFEQLYRVLKNNTHLYMFSDAETMFHMKPAAEQAKFKFKNIIVWDKQKIGMGYNYRYQVEYILFFEKGKRKLNSFSIPNILYHKRIKTNYPTEKPAPILETLIKQSSNENELILDPFMGSGSCLEAANNLKRKFIGNDLSEIAFELAKGRI